MPAISRASSRWERSRYYRTHTTNKLIIGRTNSKSRTAQPNKGKEQTMKCYLEQPLVRHATRSGPRDRRAVAWQRISFQTRARGALTKTRTESLLAGLVVALLTSAVLSRPGLG